MTAQEFVGSLGVCVAEVPGCNRWVLWLCGLGARVKSYTRVSLRSLRHGLNPPILRSSMDHPWWWYVATTGLLLLRRPLVPGAPWLCTATNTAPTPTPGDRKPAAWLVPPGCACNSRRFTKEVAC